MGFGSPPTSWLAAMMPVSGIHSLVSRGRGKHLTKSASPAISATAHLSCCTSTVWAETWPSMCHLTLRHREIQGWKTACSNVAWTAHLQHIFLNSWLLPSSPGQTLTLPLSLSISSPSASSLLLAPAPDTTQSCFIGLKTAECTWNLPACTQPLLGVHGWWGFTLTIWPNLGETSQK